MLKILLSGFINISQRRMTITSEVLCIVLVFISCSDAQSACDYVGGSQSGGGSNPSLTITLSEANATDLSKPDSEKSAYRAYLGIYGILNGNEAATGISISLSPLQSTPSAISFHPNNATFTFLQRVLPSNSTVGNLNSGVYLEIQNPLDREGPTSNPSDDIYSFDLLAQCTPRAGSVIIYTLTVILRDVNDNAPQFSNSDYYLSVNELTPVGVSIVTDISATDQDLGTNAQFDVSIVPRLDERVDGSQMFGLVNDGFRIYVVVKRTLDFESLTQGQNYYVLKIEAVDKPVNINQRKTSTATLSVSILDNNDLDPEFLYTGCITVGGVCLHPVYKSSIKSGSLDSSLIVYTDRNNSNGQPQQVTIQARDRDTLNASIQFFVVQTFPSGYENNFGMTTTGPINGNVYTGILSQLRVINRKNVRNIKILIKAVESSNVERFATATVDVTVEPANNNAPVLSIPFVGYIYENSLNRTYVTNSDNTQLLQLSVYDHDLGSDEVQRVRYTVDTNLFYITDDGFVICKTDQLDFETNKFISFTVTARETNTIEQRSVSQPMVVNILDVNDNAPQFTAGTYVATIPAGDYTVFPLFIKKITATDRDTGLRGKVMYEILRVSNSGLGKFSINETSGNVTVTSTVNNGEKYTIAIKATDLALPEANRRSNIALVDVEVTSNGYNKAPVISSSWFNISVSEGVPVGSLIFTVPATDPEGGVLNFRITNGNRLNFFNIGPNTGRIINNGVLDREAWSQFTLVVLAQDTSMLSATATLYIKITDINDNAPVFEQSLYIFNIEEGKGSAKVGTVKAVDIDENSNGNIQSYSISHFSPSFNMFYINSVSGEIFTSRALDYESIRIHTLLVLASDQAADSRTGTTTVSIYVTDVPDALPYFTKTTYDIFVPENTPQGSLLLTITAQDDDVVKNINYKFKDGDVSKFSIGRLNGQIFLNLPLDYETKKLHEFSVTTFEGENASTLQPSKTTVRISVMDVNDNAPVISVLNDYVSVLETEPVGSVIATLNATDKDQSGTHNSEVVWTVSNVTSNVGSQSKRHLFDIIPNTGQLIVRRPLYSDTDKATQYYVSVQAQDLGVPPLKAVKTLTVDVIRNRLPRFNSSSFEININSNREPSSRLFAYPAVDDDQMSPFKDLSYSLIPSGRLPNHFNINPQTSEVSLVKSLLLDDSREYFLHVVATDGGGLSATSTATLSVLRNLHKPEWTGQGPYNFNTSIQESQLLLTTVFTVDAIDKDVQAPNNWITYNITGDDTALDYFTMQGNRLQLKRSPTDNPSLSVFIVRIGIQDSGYPVLYGDQEAIVTVNVIRRTHSGVFFTKTYYEEVNDNVNIGYSVVWVQATSQNNSASITYSMIGNYNGSQFFHIDPNTGQIKTKGKLSTDKTSQFTLLVIASDGGNPPKTANTFVYIKIVRNFHAPEWIQTSFSVTLLDTYSLDNTLNVDLMARVQDLDVGGNNKAIKLKLLGSDLAVKYFQIDDTGKISLKRSLQHDMNTDQYLLYITASDLGDPPKVSTGTATVTVTVLHNRAPVLTASAYSTNINEDKPVGTIVSQLTATDPDAGVAQFGDLTFHLEGFDSASQYFQVNPSSGILSVKENLASSGVDRFQVLIRVSDSGTPSLSDEVIIRVTVVHNLHPPELIQLNYSVTILESEPACDPVGITIKVLDRDQSAPNNVIKYTGTSIDDTVGLSYFDVDSNGDIYVKRTLTPGTRTQYKMGVIVSDMGTPSLKSQQTATVAITVQRNRYTPSFNNLPSTNTIPYNSPLNTVFVVQASDDDPVAPFNTLKYTIVTGATDFFTINEANGRVSLIKDIRQATASQFELAVRVQDGGNPPRESIKMLVFTVDRPTPVPFLSSGNKFYISTSSIIVSVLILKTLLCFT